MCPSKEISLPIVARSRSSNWIFTDLGVPLVCLLHWLEFFSVREMETFDLLRAEGNNLVLEEAHVNLSIEQILSAAKRRKKSRINYFWGVMPIPGKPQSHYAHICSIYCIIYFSAVDIRKVKNFCNAAEVWVNCAWETVGCQDRHRSQQWVSNEHSSRVACRLEWN